MPETRKQTVELPDAGLFVDHIGASELAIYFGYEGALVPPGDGAKLDDAIRTQIERLSKLCLFGVVSERDVSELRECVGLDSVVYVGNHGFEVVAAHGKRIDPKPGDDYLPDLAEVGHELSRLLGEQADRLIRHRFLHKLTLDGLEADEAARLEEVVDEVLANRPELTAVRSTDAVEIMPAVGWHEGAAMEWALEAIERDTPGVTPVYVGPSSHPFDPFRFLGERGISIVVGEPGEKGASADFWLPDTDAVLDFLVHLTEHLDRVLSREGWMLRYDKYDPDKEGTRESLCTLGNGYFATRGAAPEADADDIHYPGTYIAAFYNRLSTDRAGRKVENEDLVNLPNWLSLKFRIDGEEWFDLDEVDIESYEQTLDIKHGLLHRHVRFRDRLGRTTKVDQTRFVHMDDPHLGGLKTTVKPVDWSGVLEIRSVLDGQVVNDNVRSHAELRKRHLEVLDLEEVDSHTVFLRVRTVQSRREVAQAARTQVYRNGEVADAHASFVHDVAGEVGHHYVVDVERDDKLVVEKLVAMFNSRDVAVSECGYNAQKHIRRAPRFDEAVVSHQRAWNHIWRRFDIGMVCRGECRMDAMPVMILRLHVFHLVQTASPNTRDIDTGIPARGWHGEAYRGHVFWDELFIFPLLNLRMPEITRALLLYRHRRLDEARHRACDIGCKGALYPWQSGSDGEEETPMAHYQPDSKSWKPENTWLQRHISAAVAYNVWQYYQVTGDLEFLDRYGSEIILEVARFYANLATYNNKIDRYEIRHVVGPDEYHDRYPGAEELGVHNNAYTNLMAVWVLTRALEVLELLPRRRAIELCERLHVTHREVDKWHDVSRKMRVIVLDDGLISQFEGYETLEELDRDRYRQEYGGLQHIAAVLEEEGRDINEYKISKQADVLMLFYLFSDKELQELFARIDVEFDEEMVGRNVDYYLERTAHGSSLSRIVHSWVEADRNPARGWGLFTEALLNDVADTQGGTTPEGIHLGAMAGTVDIVERSFVGLEIREDVLRFKPNLPDEIEWLHVNLRYRGHSLAVTLQHDELRVTTDESCAPPIQVGFGDDVFEMSGLESRVFSLPCH
ncbi:trehalose-phosphatase [Persicimonas caeni]|uniref:Trehalose-phosphatase n=1 Tax=Persicimonas caeni TaxID=2292766 RepID=A0A4Y6Q001_PERCE|nr:glycosyl hydrolase family 65 protein [Persicimonas caeni]QDG53843.1 trehalose-phosphatase [Persicimonas caeni]QED35064.1 trehalose-phosphatase [Persicimonas caeni]